MTKAEIPSRERKCTIIGVSGPTGLGPGGCAKVWNFSGQGRKCGLTSLGVCGGGVGVVVAC